METTKTNNETTSDSAKISENCLNATSEAMMDIYRKQLQFTTSLYHNFFNSLLATNRSSNENKNFSDMFLNSDLGKWSETMLNDFSNNSSPLFTRVDGIYKQMSEYNSILLASLNSIKANQIDWKVVNAEYFKTLESQIESSKKIGNSLSETYNKQMDLSIETNKKVVQEIYTQLDLLIKQNQRFVSEFFKAPQSAPIVEDKKTKETSANETKKKWEVPVIH